MKIRRSLFTLLTLVFVASRAAAADVPSGFQYRTMSDADGKQRSYVLFVPYKLEPSSRPPIVLFLHGAGERGSNGLDPMMVGIGPAIWKQKSSFPAVVVIPQCHVGSGWLAETPDAAFALQALAAAQKEFNTDPDRVYLTGLSMGGAGTWSLAARDPKMFAAIVPMCSRADLKIAEKLAAAKLPIWNFCGDKDRPETVAFNREMHKALTAAGAGDRYTEYEGVGHNCWDAAYGTPELFTWMFAQNRSNNQ